MKRVTALGLGLLAVCGFAGVMWAGQVELDGEASVAVASAFVWRGKVMNDDIMIQPEVTLRSAPWTVNVWGSWDWDTKDGAPVNSRVDTSILYDYSWKNLFLGVGLFIHAYHDSPTGLRDTYEAYVNVAANVALCPSLEVFYDFGTVEGVYAKVSVGTVYEFSERADVSLRLGVGAGSGGFNENFYGARVQTETGEEEVMNKASFADVTASATGSISIGREFTIVPRVEYVALLDRDLRSGAKAAGDDPDNLVGSLALRWEF